MRSKWKRARRIAATALFLTMPATSAVMLAAMAAGIARDGVARDHATTRPTVAIDLGDAR